MGLLSDPTGDEPKSFCCRNSGLVAQPSALGCVPLASPTSTFQWVRGEKVPATSKLVFSHVRRLRAHVFSLGLCAEARALFMASQRRGQTWPCSHWAVVTSSGSEPIMGTLVEPGSGFCLGHFLGPSSSTWLRALGLSPPAAGLRVLKPGCASLGLANPSWLLSSRTKFFTLGSSWGDWEGVGGGRGRRMHCI